MVGGAARAQLGALLENELIHQDAAGFALNPEVEYSLRVVIESGRPIAQVAQGAIVAKSI